MGGGETERFCDKKRMTKTEREAEQTTESVCVCVCAYEGNSLSYVHHRLWMS